MPPDTLPPDVAQVSGYYTSTMQGIVGRARVRYMQSLQLLHCSTHDEQCMNLRLELRHRNCVDRLKQTRTVHTDTAGEMTVNMDS